MSDGSGPVRTLALLRRADGMTFAEFDSYWRDVHAPLAAQVPGISRYVQRHVVPNPETGEPDNGFGIDGLAWIDYYSRESMNEGWATPAGAAALADVPNFLGLHFVVELADFVVIGDVPS
jgi:uncharacterized protein (TIGR02118 family)